MSKIINIKKLKLFNILALIIVLSLAICGCDDVKNLILDKDDVSSDSTNEGYNSGDGDPTNDLLGIDKLLGSDVISTMEEEDNDRQSDAKDSAIQVYSPDGDLLETHISVIDEDEENYSDGNEIYADDLANSINAHGEDHNWCYAYGMLNDSQKNTYVEIYAVLTDMQDNVVLTSKDTKEIDLAFRSVMVDHPEIFYVKGYSLGKYMYGTTIDRIALTGTYTMSKDAVEQKNREVERYITNVISNAPTSGDYEKIKYVYEYLIMNNKYVENAPNNQNILSVVENGKTVCQGYAKMTQLLLNRMGMFCTLVNGTALGSNGVGGGRTDEWGAHVWNIVKCNECYYNVDTTWGDAAFTFIGEEGTMPSVDINYEFLLVDDDELSKTHRSDPVVEMPRCDSFTDNYYVHEGCYFIKVNPEQLKNVFDKAYATGQTLVFLKATENSYPELKNYLVDEQHIFDYVSQDNVRYVEYGDRSLILISL